MLHAPPLDAAATSAVAVYCTSGKWQHIEECTSGKRHTKKNTTIKQPSDNGNDGDYDHSNDGDDDDNTNGTVKNGTVNNNITTTATTTMMMENTNHNNNSNNNNNSSSSNSSSNKQGYLAEDRSC